MDRVLLATALAAAVIAVALAARRLRPASSGVDAPGEQGWSLPQHLQRADLPHADAPWLVAVFWSATCDTCHGVLDAARRIEGGDVAVTDVEYGERPDLHRRYGIEAVPAVAIVDHQGGVHRWLLGPGSADGLATALVEARGSDAPTGAGTDVQWPRRSGRADEVG